MKAVFVSEFTFIIITHTARRLHFGRNSSVYQVRNSAKSMLKSEVCRRSSERISKVSVSSIISMVQSGENSSLLDNRLHRNTNRRSCSRRSTDRTLDCGSKNRGSIPRGSTKWKNCTCAVFSFGAPAAGRLHDLREESKRRSVFSSEEENGEAVPSPSASDGEYERRGR